ncbi:exosortase-associated protein EpsI, B-type [Nitrosomonas sp.]|uniref:exosortase-associated protein EpsI, B-type n=1 Tax=Nitrosomonas sp. TaxID=42353 RepID=UPI001D581D6F|nr:exosortase-associated protein EpsI, B-type [Nitrosomonas sp.]MCB1947497.1 EpsI family protein [Nitrosomonas sp.]MCP5244268.1 EpsI family protein [Burkholderiales bacterium]MDR4514983.1 EpsI family protein [Nitrosomonas sp.]
MKKPLLISLSMGILMISTAALTTAMTPTIKIADLRDTVNLETLIPASFNDWKIDASIVPLQVDPKTQAQLDKLYNQTLARTYVNSQGIRVMLAVAYGGDQSDQLSLHKPEVCYLAQGFEIKQNTAGEIATQFGDLPGRRLLAIRGNRIEPITYWVTIGDKAVLSGINQKLQQIRYGLSGNVPDGMLVRVSTLGANTDQAFQIQEFFIQDMLSSMEIKMRNRLIGTFDL